MEPTHAFFGHIDEMSLEDVGTNASLGAKTRATDGSLEVESMNIDQDGIFMDKIAFLSPEMFDASAFKGRFSKIHRSKKRKGLLDGR